MVVALGGWERGGNGDGLGEGYQNIDGFEQAKKHVVFRLLL